MSREESLTPEGSPGPPTPSPEPPDEEALLRHVRQSLARAGRRRQRRQQLLIAVGTLLVATGLVITVISLGRWTRQQGAPPPPQAIEPAAVPPRETGAAPASQPEPSTAQKGRAVATREPVSPPPTITPSPSQPRKPPPRAVSVSYQPRARLRTVRSGDPKEKVFEVFATAVERRKGSLVRIEGMRLRATGRSRHHAKVEVAEAKIADTAAGSLYWFLFGDDRLVAWGRPEEWVVAAARYQVEIDYQPEAVRADRPGG